jgi:hypothetical protein
VWWQFYSRLFVCVHVHLPLYTHSFSFFSSLILLSLVRQTHGAGLCSASPGSLQDLFYDAYRDEKSLGRNNALQVNKSGWSSGLRSYLIRMAKRSKTHSFFIYSLLSNVARPAFRLSSAKPTPLTTMWMPMFWWGESFAKHASSARRPENVVVFGWKRLQVFPW